ncbi:hypothetical protein D3C81_2216840 [compost metagenome]
MQYLQVMGLHLSLVHPGCFGITDGEKTVLHVADVLHGLVEPQVELRQQLLELVVQPVEAGGRSCPFALQQLIDLGIGEIGV